jgi:D-aspartate ligase
VATAYYLDQTGQAIPAGEQLPGRSVLVESYDPLAALGYWRRGEIGLTSWLRSLRAIDEVAWFASDDLRPFGLMCLRMGWRLATRPLAGAPRRTTRSERPAATRRPAATAFVTVHARRSGQGQRAARTQAAGGGSLTPPWRGKD